MKLCLKCCSLWESSAIYCGKCRRPLGKRCPKGHSQMFFSPAVTCLICNEGPLDGLPYLSLGWVASGITLVLLVIAWRWIWDHPWQSGNALWRTMLWALGILFDTAPNSVALTIRHILTWYVSLFLLSFLLPHGAGRSIRQSLKMLPRYLWRGLYALLGLMRSLVLRPLGQKVKDTVIRSKDSDIDDH